MDIPSASTVIIYLLDQGNASATIHEAHDIDFLSPDEFKTHLRCDVRFDDYLDMVKNLEKEEIEDLVLDGAEQQLESLSIPQYTPKRSHVRQLANAVGLLEQGVPFQTLWQRVRSIFENAGRRPLDDVDSGYGNSRQSSSLQSPAVASLPTSGAMNLTVTPAHHAESHKPPPVKLSSAPASFTNTNMQATAVEPQSNMRKRKSKGAAGSSRTHSETCPLSKIEHITAVSPEAPRPQKRRKTDQDVTAAVSTARNAVETPNKNDGGAPQKSKKPRKPKSQAAAAQKATPIETAITPSSIKSRKQTAIAQEATPDNTAIISSASKRRKQAVEAQETTPERNVVTERSSRPPRAGVRRERRRKLRQVKLQQDHTTASLQTHQTETSAEEGGAAAPTMISGSTVSSNDSDDHDQRENDNVADSDDDESDQDIKISISFPPHLARTMLASSPVKQWFDRIDSAIGAPMSALASRENSKSPSPPVENEATVLQKETLPVEDLRLKDIKAPAQGNAGSPSKSDTFETAQEYQSSAKSVSESAESSESSPSSDHSESGTETETIKRDIAEGDSEGLISTLPDEHQENGLSETETAKAVDATDDNGPPAADMVDETSMHHESPVIEAQTTASLTEDAAGVAPTQAPSKEVNSSFPANVDAPVAAAKPRPPPLNLKGSNVEDPSKPVRSPLKPWPSPKAGPELKAAARRLEKFCKYGHPDHPTDSEETEESTSSSDTDNDGPRPLKRRTAASIAREKYIDSLKEKRNLKAKSHPEPELPVTAESSYKSQPNAEIPTVAESSLKPQPPPNDSNHIQTFASFDSDHDAQHGDGSSPSPDIIDPSIMDYGGYVPRDDDMNFTTKDQNVPVNDDVQASDDGAPSTESARASHGEVVVDDHEMKHGSEEFGDEAHVDRPTNAIHDKVQSTGNADSTSEDDAMADASTSNSHQQAARNDLGLESDTETTEILRITNYRWVHDPALGEYDPENHDGPRPESATSFLERVKADEAICSEEERAMVNSQILSEAGLLGDREPYAWGTPRRNPHFKKRVTPQRSGSPEVVIYKSPAKVRAQFQEHQVEDIDEEGNGGYDADSGNDAEPKSEESSPLDELSQSPLPISSQLVNEAGGEDDADDADDEKPKKRKRKTTGNKSEHFTSPSPKKKRAPAGTTSRVLLPILTAPRFGIIQEELANDPFKLLLAVTFLNKTAGKSAVPVYRQLMEEYPTPEALAEASHDDVCDMIRHLGLQNQRAKRLVRLANTWVLEPPEKARRHRTRDYPRQGDGRDLKPKDIVEEDTVQCAGTLEIGHIFGTGPYAWDSWRMFCRDKLRGVANGYNGEGTAADGIGKDEDFEPEWKRVVPLDKELRACLRWMWLREGWVWDPLTGQRTVASPELVQEASERETEWEMLDEVIRTNNSGMEQDLPGTQEEPQTLVEQQLRSPRGPDVLENATAQDPPQRSSNVISLPEEDSPEIAETEPRQSTSSAGPDTPPRSSVPTNTRQRSTRRSSISMAEEAANEDQEMYVSSPMLERANRSQAKSVDHRVIESDSEEDHEVPTSHQLATDEVGETPQEDEDDSASVEEGSEKSGDEHEEDMPMTSQQATVDSQDPYDIGQFLGQLQHGSRGARERHLRNIKVYMDEEEKGYANRAASEEL